MRTLILLAPVLCGCLSVPSRSVLVGLEPDGNGGQRTVEISQVGGSQAGRGAERSTQLSGRAGTGFGVAAPRAGAGAQPRSGGTSEVAGDVVKERISVEEANRRQPFRIRTEDVLRLFVLGVPEMTYSAKVLPNGRVSLPLIGEIEVAGKSVDEIEPLVRDKLVARVASGPVRLREGDSVKMFVWRQQDLTATATVQADGRIVLPLAGEVVAKDRTLAEVQTEVEARLKQRLQDPVVTLLADKLLQRTVPSEGVSLTIQELRPRNVAVFGEVGIPGLQPLSGDLRLLDVVARAQPKHSAKTDNIVVIRQLGPSRAQYLVCDLQGFIAAKNLTQNMYLRDGDVVIVPKTAIAQVDEFIDDYFTRTLPVLNWWITAVEARYALDIARSSVELNNRIRATFGN